MCGRGIVIFALGHPYYGRYAYNLALTIKAVEDITIALISDESGISHLNTKQRSLFDQHIEHKVDMTADCSAKLWAYDLSPFDQTIVLDADMLWLPKNKPSQLFDSLTGIPFTAITEGDTDKPAGHYFFWADAQEIREKYSVEKIHQWRTEVMYFEKSELAEGLFKDAKKIYRNHGLKTVKEFAGVVPDEMAINISAAIHHVEPHQLNWQPSYWPQLYQNHIPDYGTLYDRYYLLSVGGNHNADNVKLLYNNIMKAQASKLGLQHLFPLWSKNTFLEQRRKS